MGGVKLPTVEVENAKQKINENVYTLMQRKATQTHRLITYQRTLVQNITGGGKIIMFTFLWGQYLYVPRLSVFYG